MLFNSYWPQMEQIMKNILEANANIVKILGKPHIAQNDVRLSRYCVQVPVADGLLLFHTLTRELLLLAREEAGQPLESEALKERWFVVPDSLDEKKCADTVRWVLRTTAKRPKHITSYTIMTTTDCNARCFYCYEMGRSRIPMTEETAHKTARYIREHCGGERVKLSWFGGEPLFNRNVIDIICEDLRRDGIEYSSKMISNGYLFDEDAVQKANTFWHLKMVQITLDGTEEVYNRSKAYIYRDGKSPYQVVLSGVGRLLDAGITVAVRLNLDLYNAENLLSLADELAERFHGKKGLFVYAHLLFDAEPSAAGSHAAEEWQPRYEALYRLNRKLMQYGLSRNQRIKKNLKLSHCMADSGNAVVITPGGDIGLCEHYSESEFIGHIDREGFDKAVQASWKETAPAIPECADCFFYPECLKLKKCAAGSSCFPEDRELTIRNVRQSMLHEYRLWQQNRQHEEDEADPLC